MGISKQLCNDYRTWVADEVELVGNTEGPFARMEVEEDCWDDWLECLRFRSNTGYACIGCRTPLPGTYNYETNEWQGYVGNEVAWSCDVPGCMTRSCDKRDCITALTFHERFTVHNVADVFKCGGCNRVVHVRQCWFESSYNAVVDDGYFVWSCSSNEAPKLISLIFTESDHVTRLKHYCRDCFHDKYFDEVLRSDSRHDSNWEIVKRLHPLGVRSNSFSVQYIEDLEYGMRADLDEYEGHFRDYEYDDEYDSCSDCDDLYRPWYDDDYDGEMDYDWLWDGPPPPRLFPSSPPNMIRRNE